MLNTDIRVLGSGFFEFEESMNPILVLDIVAFACIVQPSGRAGRSRRDQSPKLPRNWHDGTGFLLVSF